jgi:hypothetical protein
MSGKINLITDPDILANDNLSILLINLKNDDEQLLTDYLSKHDLICDINLYVHRNENPNLLWLLNSFQYCKNAYINLDEIDPVAGTYATYFIGRSKTYFCTKTEDMATIMNPISVNRIEGIVDFFQKLGLVDNGQGA